MFPAVCAECGIDTQVPFEPREDRPVYWPPIVLSPVKSFTRKPLSNRLTTPRMLK
jgi:CxxC-x17-CxxC domain-containing protein